MAANTDPIYSKVGDIQWGSLLTAANTATDGTGTVSVDFTADATNGGRVERVRGLHAGTNIATVVRIFINNGSTNTTAANNFYFADYSAAANTLSQTNAQTPAYDGSTAPFPVMLPPGYRLLRTQGTAVAAGILGCAVGGKY
jgi:hypothetical protein